MKSDGELLLIAAQQADERLLGYPASRRIQWLNLPQNVRDYFGTYAFLFMRLKRKELRVVSKKLDTARKA